MDSKVYLSPIENDHVLKYMGHSDDPELIDAMGWRPFGPEEKDRFLTAAETLTLPCCGDSQSIIFSIVTTEGAIPIGYVILKGINRERRSTELGIAIMDDRYRAGGYGSEAIGLAADYAFNVLQLAVLGLTVFPSNERAIRAYRKVGFKTVDVLEKAWMMPDGRRLDMLVMELKKEDWRQRIWP